MWLADFKGSVVGVVEGRWGGGGMLSVVAEELGLSACSNSADDVAGMWKPLASVTGADDAGIAAAFDTVEAALAKCQALALGHTTYTPFSYVVYVSWCDGDIATVDVVPGTNSAVFAVSQTCALGQIMNTSPSLTV